MRILIVDDKVQIAKGAADFLREFLDGDNEVLEAESGEKAMTVLQVKPADLVVTDQEMRPGMNGDELAAWIKERFKISVVLWSTNALPPKHKADFSLLKGDTDALLAYIKQLRKTKSVAA